MILFHKTFENYYKINNYSDKLLLLDNCKYSEKQTYVNFNQANDKKLIVLLNSSLNISLAKSSNKILNHYVNSKFISRNFWQKIFNQYWQETIFISISNSSIENYINKLKSNGLLIYKPNDYKSFLSNFSKALINGQIQVNLINKSNISQDTQLSSFLNKNHLYIKYIWKKGINWHLSRFYNQCIAIKTKLNNDINMNIYNIEHTSLPIFTIANNYNQIIMSECSDQILLNKNIFQSIYQFYDRLIFKNSQTKKIYTGLFFTNPEDAHEYKDHITSKYKISSHDNYLKFIIGKLNLYSRLLKYPIQHSDFRLIPDLKEVSDFIYYYQYYKNIKIHKDQLYGKNYFQGQPVYCIQPVIAKNIYNHQKSIINYTYNLKKNNKLVKYNAIFLNYETAMNAWKKFKQNNAHYKLPQKPLLYVSSLEKFLQDFNNDKQNTNFIFIPSVKTYQFIKNFKEKETNELKNNWKYLLTNRNLYLKRFFKRIFWSLTSRQPINW